MHSQSVLLAQAMNFMKIYLSYLLSLQVSLLIYSNNTYFMCESGTENQNSHNSSLGKESSSALFCFTCFTFWIFKPYTHTHIRRATAQNRADNYYMTLFHSIIPTHMDMPGCTLDWGRNFMGKT